MSVLDLARPDTAPPAVAAGGADSGRASRWVLAALVVAGAVLRVWWALSCGLTFDETFTAMAGRRSLTAMLDYLATTDSHPPLDYLLRMPLARMGASDLAFRFPSIVFSVTALALFAWWMRGRGVVGIVATGLMAVSGFAIAYGSEARMYALLELLGVVAAVTAESWLREPKRAHAWVVCGLVFVGCLDHASMLLLAGGLMALAGVRRDRDAWRWRFGVAIGLLLWVPLWGPSLLRQQQGSHTSWIPPTSARGFVDAVVSQVTLTDGVTWMIALGVVAGTVCLARSHRRLFAVWCSCAGLPFVAAAAIGVLTPFFLNRTLTFAMWAPVLAVGALVGAIWRRWRAAGVVVATILRSWRVPVR